MTPEKEKRQKKLEKKFNSAIKNRACLGCVYLGGRRPIEMMNYIGRTEHATLSLEERRRGYTQGILTDAICFHDEWLAVYKPSMQLSSYFDEYKKKAADIKKTSPDTTLVFTSADDYLFLNKHSCKHYEKLPSDRVIILSTYWKQRQSEKQARFNRISIVLLIASIAISAIGVILVWRG